MSNNRHLVNDLDIIRPAQLLDKGLPLPGFSGRYIVDEGWCAVITEGGAFREIIWPGTHFLSKYNMWRDVKAVAIDMRIQTLTVATTGEFTIAQPVPVKINLDLGIEYRVSDPRRVALEVKTPLTNLYDRVIQAVRSIIVHTTYDEFRTQGENIARATLQRLQGMQLPKLIGLEASHVLVTSITGADAVAQQQIKEYTTLRDWQVDQAMLQGTQVTPEWLMVHRPEIYQQMLAGNTEIFKELIDKGLLDPAHFLNQPVGAVPSEWQRMFGAMGFGLPQMATTAQKQVPQIPASPERPVTDIDTRARIKEELSYIQGIPDAQVEARAGQDEVGLPDGTYSFKVDLPDKTGGVLTVYLLCPVGYPKVSPALEVEVNGCSSDFESAILRRWKGQYLVEIVREVQTYYGA